ncbi:MAG: putative amidohydrolase YtcJ, partial [Acidimicrobiales bacterium]
TASVVAVRDGRILGVGTVEELTAWGEHSMDDKFANKIIMPGFGESHCYAMSAGMWEYPYVGFFDRRSSDGRLWQGCKNIAEVVAGVAEIDAGCRRRR